MGMDTGLLGLLHGAKHGRDLGLWGDRVLAVLVGSLQTPLPVAMAGLCATRIKVISITIFFIVGIFISAGVIGPQKIGFKYWDDRKSPPARPL